MTTTAAQSWNRKSSEETRAEVLLDLASGNPFSRLAPRTFREYTRKCDLLVKKIGGDPNGSPRQFFEYLAGRIKDKSFVKSTFRSERSLIKFYLKREMTKHTEGSEEFARYMDAFLDVSSLSESSLLNSNGQTSSNKAKSFPEIFRRIIIQKGEQGELKHRQASNLIQYIRANSIVGLRPIEWFSAEIFPDTAEKTISMRVKNAKHSHGRANGEYRTLHLHGITKEETTFIIDYLDTIDAIKKQAPDGEDAELFFSKYHESLQATLRSVFRRIIKQSGGTQLYGMPDNKLPTIYSLRHQVVADAKAGGLSPIEISAFFGHSSVNTAKEHYGRKHSGSGKPFRFKPSTESMMAVTNRMNMNPVPAPSARVQQRAEQLFDEINGKT